MGCGNSGRRHCVSENVGESDVSNAVIMLEDDREAAVWLFYEGPCLADGQLDVG
jgi:hypothetical protein